MARAEYGPPELRASVPTLEPDEAFLARLSELAAGSGASRPPAGDPSLPGWRVGLAAASVAAVVGGLAWLASSVSGDESPPPSPPPVTQPTDPRQTGTNQELPEGSRDSGAGSAENEGPGGSRDPGGVTGGSVGSAAGRGWPERGQAGQAPRQAGQAGQARQAPRQARTSPTASPTSPTASPTSRTSPTASRTSPTASRTSPHGKPDKPDKPDKHHGNPHDDGG